ncbi:MAG: hypothetical protein WCS43_14705 [Verrucomicrobiota bacterium]
MLRILLVLLGLAASLQAGERGLVDFSVSPAATTPKDTTFAIGMDSAAKQRDARSLNAPSRLQSTNPSSVTDSGSSIAADVPHESSSRNPWLYIIIGFLLVTGILLYVDPRIF